MLATVAVTVGTHDLAQGVLVGVLLSGFFFAHKVGQILRVTSRTEDEGRTRTYTVTGQVFLLRQNGSSMPSITRKSSRRCALM